MGCFDDLAHGGFAADHGEALDEREGEAVGGGVVGDPPVAGRMAAGALRGRVQELPRRGWFARVENDRPFGPAVDERERGDLPGAREQQPGECFCAAGGGDERSRVWAEPGGDVASEVERRRAGGTQRAEQTRVGVRAVRELRPGAERRVLQRALRADRRAGEHGRGRRHDRGGVGGGALVRGAPAAREPEREQRR